MWCGVGLMHISEQWKSSALTHFMLLLFQVVMKSGGTPIQRERHAQSRKAKQVHYNHSLHFFFFWTTPVLNPH